MRAIGCADCLRDLRDILYVYAQSNIPYDCAE